MPRRFLCLLTTFGCVGQCLGTDSLSVGNATSLGAPPSDWDKWLKTNLNKMMGHANGLVTALMPDPLVLTLKKDGSTGSTCITRVPRTCAFGKCVGGNCICSASAGYSVSFGTIKGLKSFQIMSFPDVTFKDDGCGGKISVQFGSITLRIENGKASARAGACGISPKGSTTFGVTAKWKGPTMTLSVQGSRQNGWCRGFSMKGSGLTMPDLDISDPSVKISLFGLPGIDVGKIIDKVIIGMVKDLFKNPLTNLIKSKISPEVTKVTNEIVDKAMGKTLGSSWNLMKGSLAQLDDEDAQELEEVEVKAHNTLFRKRRDEKL